MRITLALLGLAVCLPARAEHLDHQGERRSYQLHVPPGGAAGRPMVVLLHGGGGTGQGMDRMTNNQLTKESAARRWVLVLPEGVAKGWNDGRPLVGRREKRRAGVDDVAFLDALIEHLLATHRIDRTRVYMAGMSNGGFMTQRFAIDRSETVAAIGVVTANVAEAWAGRRPAAPVPVLYINGTEDPLVPFKGGQVRVLRKDRGAVRSSPASAAWWAGFNGCTGEPRSAPLTNTKRDGTRGILESHRGCRAPVHLLRVEGGGHTWPGGRQYLPKLMIGRVSEDFSATSVMFDFFENHHR